MQRVDEAVQLADTALADGCDDPGVCDRVSLRLERAKDFKSAAAACRRVLDSNPPQRHVGLVEVLQKRHDRCVEKQLVSKGTREVRGDGRSRGADEVSRVSAVFAVLIDDLSGTRWADAD